MPLYLKYLVSAVVLASVLFLADHKMAAFISLVAHVLSYQLRVLELKIGQLLEARVAAPTGASRAGP